MLSYGALVKVAMGFYAGCMGMVIEGYSGVYYKVELKCKSPLGIQQYTKEFNSAYLDVITEKEYNKYLYGN